MQNVAEQAFQITQCVTCGHALPTLVVGAKEGAREWECRNCGATYLAQMADSSPAHLRTSVTLTHYFPEHREAATTLQAKELEHELRRHPRRPMMMTVPAMELDDDLFPLGEDFTVITRNLSSSGIAIVHTRPLERKLAVLIELPKLGYVQLLLEIVRCKSVGPLFEMGGAFFERR